MIIDSDSKINYYKFLLNNRASTENDEYEIYYFFKILNFNSVNAISREIDKLRKKIDLDARYPTSHRFYLVLSIVITSILPFVTKPNLPLAVYIFEGLYGLFFVYFVSYFILVVK